MTPRSRSNCDFTSGNRVLKLLGSASSTNVPIAPLSLTPTISSMAENGEICAICLNAIRKDEDNVYKSNNCAHEFHEECIYRWRKEQDICPLCRGPLSEKPRATGLAQYIRRVNLGMVIFRILPTENQSPLRTRQKIANVILTPFGLAWVILIITILFVLEVTCISLSLPVLFVVFMCEICRECSINCSSICYVIDELIPLIVVGVIFVLYAFLWHTLLMIGIALIFCFKVCLCKKRWKDAFPYITRRTLSETFPYLL